MDLVENQTGKQKQRMIMKIKKEWIHSLAKVIIEEFKADILEKIKIVREKDGEVVRIVEEMKKTKVKVL